VERIAVIADVHGNAQALEAVIAEIEREAPDVIVVAGDVAGGPQQDEVLDRLMGLERARFVRGNVDRVVVEAFDEQWTFDPDEGSIVRRAGAWAAERLTQKQRDFLASFEDTVVVGDVLVCHGSPRSDDEIITSLTPEPDLRTVLAGVEQRLVVCGHTHVQFDRTVGGVRLVNTGSIGDPFEGRRGAFWLMLAPDVELRSTEYDCEQAAERIRASDYWDAETTARRLLDPPDPREMEELFERGARDTRGPASWRRRSSTDPAMPRARRRRPGSCR
jgi:putative phosphoesterase